MRLILVAFFFCIFALVYSQSASPYPAYQEPVDYGLRLSGTFGELRSNHFHTGIDIKGGIGKPIYAIGDGYIAQIKVQAGGYGNVLYLNHPEGYTSVYAHLDAFSPELAAFIKEKQYATQSFEQHLQLEPDQFPVRKGQQIGKMGTTGYSFGPHLHFEIRRTEGQVPLNPLQFGLFVPDARPPRMHQVKAYFLDQELQTVSTRTWDLQYGKGGYFISRDTIYLPVDRLGLALKVYDHMDEVSNWNGVYEISMLVDDSLYYQFRADSVHFEERRYLNAHLDYAEQVNRKSYFNRAFILPGNNLKSIYGTIARRGIIKLSAEQAREITFSAKDFAGNEVGCVVWFKRSREMPAQPSTTFQYFIPWDQETWIDNYYLKVRFPEGVLYEDTPLTYYAEEEDSENVYAATHSLGGEDIPLHEYISLGLRPSLIPDQLKPYAFIAHCSEDESGSITNMGGKWEGDYLVTKILSLGAFTIMTDTIPPSITPIHFPDNWKKGQVIRFKVKDNFNYGGPGNALNYRAMVDGRWVLMEFDGKNDLLFHRVDDLLEQGMHQFRLEVTDALGNTNVFEREITR